MLRSYKPLLLVAVLAAGWLVQGAALAFPRLLHQVREAPSGRGGATQILVQYSDACAENVALRVQIQGGKTYRDAAGQVDRLVADSVQTVRAECRKIERIDVGVSDNTGRTQPLTAELSAANGWRFAPEPVIGALPGHVAFRSSFPQLPGSIRVAESGEVSGRMPLGDGLSARFEGRVTPVRSGNHVSQYQIEGYLYDYAGPVAGRGAKKQCDTPRKGYAYWSSFQWTASSDDTLWQGAGGNHWPCAEANTAGPTFQTSFSIDDANPFKVVTAAKSAAPTPAGPITLAQGKGWRLTTDDKLWCSNASVHTLTYDAPHTQRMRSMGYVEDAYVPFIEQVLQPQLRRQCPTLSSFGVRMVRAGEADAYDYLDYEPDPKLGRSKLRRGPQIGLTRDQYLHACAGCHATGAGGAPVSGQAKGWNRQRPAARQAWARDDTIYHFHNMHCPDCSSRDIDALLHNIDGPYLPGPARLDARQTRLADYARNPGPKQLLSSGLLHNAKLIEEIYLGKPPVGATRDALQGLFAAYLVQFNDQCADLLPAKTRTYTISIRRLDRTEYGPSGRTNVYVDTPVKTYHVNPRYYDKFVRAMKRPPTADKDGGQDAARRNMADMKALLPNPGYCSNPATRQFEENLFLAQP